MNCVAKRLTVKLHRPLRAVRAADGATGRDGPDGLNNYQDAGTGQEQLQTRLAELTATRDALGDAVAKFQQLRQKILQEAEGQLVELALGIAKKVLMQEIQAGKYEIEPIIKEALLHVPVHQDVVVHLHPDDFAVCKMIESDEKVGEMGGIRFVSDHSIKRAECVLETSQGIVESAVEAHLENISEALKGGE